MKINAKYMLWVSFSLNPSFQFSHYEQSELNSGLLTLVGNTSRDILISKDPTKFVVKISVNS